VDGETGRIPPGDPFELREKILGYGAPAEQSAWGRTPGAVEESMNLDIYIEKV
jgi:hypothetical protein